AIVGGDPLQSANGDGLLFDSAAAAGRFARSIAHPSQDTREYVGFSIHHVGVGEFALGDEPDVFRNVGVCRASPLAVDHPMEVVRFRSISRLHVSSLTPPASLEV